MFDEGRFLSAAIAMSRSGNRRFVLAWVRFALRWDFAFMTEASNATAHAIRGPASADIASKAHWTKPRILFYRSTLRRSRGERSFWTAGSAARSILVEAEER
jgi:hypothetical protein